MHLTGNVWNNFERQEYDNNIIFRNHIKAWAFPTRFVTESILNSFQVLYLKSKAENLFKQKLILKEKVV